MTPLWYLGPGHPPHSPVDQLYIYELVHISLLLFGLSSYQVDACPNGHSFWRVRGGWSDLRRQQKSAGLFQYITWTLSRFYWICGTGCDTGQGCSIMDWFQIFLSGGYFQIPSSCFIYFLENINSFFEFDARIRRYLSITLHFVHVYFLFYRILETN